MSRIFIILLLSLSLFIFTSCSTGGDRTEMLNESKNEQDIKSIEQILSFIEKKESEGLKAIFSKTAIREDVNLDYEIEYLFNFFKGEVVSYEESGVGESETNENGIKTKKVRSFYEVETNVEKYLVFLFEVAVDTNNPENLGVYSLRIIRAEDEDTHFKSWQEMVISGIYKQD